MDEHNNLGLTHPTAIISKTDRKHYVKHGGGRSIYNFLFSFAGRVSRLSYFLRMLAVSVTAVVVYFLFLIVLVYFIRSIVGPNIIPVVTLIAFTIIWFVLTLWAHLALISRRLHDFNYSAKWIFLFIGLTVLLAVLARSLIVTLSGWFFITLVIIFIPGTKGQNRFGINNIKNIINTFD